MKPTGASAARTERSPPRASPGVDEEVAWYPITLHCVRGIFIPAHILRGEASSSRTIFRFSSRNRVPCGIPLFRSFLNYPREASVHVGDGENSRRIGGMRP
jgi:hypothetical protein